LAPSEFVLSSRRVLTPEGVRPACVRIRSGTIVSVGPESAEGLPVVDAGDAVVMPGIVDTHVHVNEPGRTEWEGFDTATRAAAAGGVTTLIDMPLNSIPPTTTIGGLHAKAESAAGRCRVHVGFWGGAVPGNAEELPRLRASGVFGFKCFLAPSGVAEFPPVGPEDLARGMEAAARLSAPLLVHAEEKDRISPDWSGPLESYRSYLETRPPAAEKEAVERLIGLCRRTGARVHVLHVSCAEAAEAIGRAKSEGVSISAETCPHYLTFAADGIPDGATQFKCAPPIRDRENRERLWGALAQGSLDLVASDHSPAPPAIKCRETGDFRKAWGGISSLELSLSAVWTGAAARGFSVADVARWMCAGPARLAGLASAKGAIAEGLDADLVVWSPEASRRVDPERLQQRHKLTPYAGRALLGVVEATYVKGEKVYDRGQILGRPSGELLLA
jgi:allantoinase